MMNVSKLDFLDEYYYEKYKDNIDKTEKQETFDLLNKFFNDRGYKVINVISKGMAYPVSIIFTKDGKNHVFKVPMRTFEPYHLNKSLGFMFDSLKKSGVLK